MSPPKVFSLAVVKGQSKGEVLRTDRKRISVGSGGSNDLVVLDPDIAKRHFMILIDQDRWKIHTYSPGESITVEGRGTHPTTRKRGALVLAASTEILLFPGDLEQSIVDAEIKKRQSDGFPLHEPRSDLVTDVFEHAIEFDSAEVANEPTISMRMGESHPTLPANAADMDLVEMSQMPTIAGERPPDDLREAARVRLLDERKPMAPSVMRAVSDPMENQPVHGVSRDEDIFEEKTVGAEWKDGVPEPKVREQKKKRGTWDTARKPEKKAEVSVPEVMAQPESQIMSLARAGESSMGARPDLDRAPEAQVIEIDSGRPKKRSNAWGDLGDEAETQLPAPKKRNAWGDGGEPSSNPPLKKKNAWGDEPSGGRSKWDSKQQPSPPPQQTALEKPGPRAMYVGPQVALPEVMRKSKDPALQLAREPDGALATSIRLLGTKIEEFARNLGYRAYMLTSAEPLTGKTTTACNLAFALAEDTHRRVALVEANFRFPRLFEILGLPEREGIIPVLEGRAKLAESVIKVKDRNLVVLPTGGRHPHPAEVLASPRFKALIAELVDTVDVAVIDAPSAWPHADANLLLPLVDAAFMVVAEQATKSIWVSRALQQLGEKRILGTIFNRIPKARSKELKSELAIRLKQ
jgi:Mrp family chromosome partitioning ATPase